MGRSCNDKGAESPRPLDPPGLAARFTRSLRSLVAVLAAPGRNRADGPFQSTQTGPRASPADCGAHVATLSRVASLPVRAFVGLPAVGRPLVALLVPRTLCRGTEAATARAPPIPRGRERVPAPRAGRATRGRAGLLGGGNERGCPLDPSRTMQAPQGAKRLRSAASVPRAQRAERRKSQPAQRATRVSRTVFRNPDGRAGRGFLHNCGSDSGSSNSCS